MSKMIAFIMVLFLGTAYSQCTLVKTDFGGNPDTIIVGTTDYIAGGNNEASIKGQRKWRDALLSSNQYKTYKSDNVIPEKYRIGIKNYFINRCGDAFYNQLKLDIVKITSIDSIKNINPNSPLLTTHFAPYTKSRTKYELEFIYYPEKNIGFSFGIALDSDGIIISEDAIPENNADLTKLVKLCELIEKIKINYPMAYSLPLEEIKLIYDEKRNKFIYVISYSNFIEKVLGKDGGCQNKCDVYSISAELFNSDKIEMKHKFGRVCIN